ncbi:MAG: type II toxin-antitoxin system VapC family toxin [Propionibacteriaceae bacterium]|jgi:tRNA(fMet)-specific endonuclease VapC|nr:type II toxin-antitoxin system VapC family toxin [Propionibacteriaceae bacterium]
MTVRLMLDTNTCSFIMRGVPQVLARLKAADAEGAVFLISAITYSELRDGALGVKATGKHVAMVEAFVERVDEVAPWDRAAVDHTALIRATLRRQGTPISPNDSAIAGHALSLGITLVANNTREFSRVAGLVLEDWATPADIPAPFPT